MDSLTDKQRAVLFFVADFKDANGFPPTVREIGESFRVTPYAALCHLRALEHKGYIRRTPMISRSIVVTEAGETEYNRHG